MRLRTQGACHLPEDRRERSTKVRARRRWQVAFVEKLCDAKSAEYTKVLVEHRENVKTHIPAAISHNHELAKILGMESGTGLVGVAGRGKGPRTLFPEAVMPWTAAEIQQWMMGVFGKQTKFRTTDEL